MQNEPILETKRLIIRPPSKDDVADFLVHINSAEDFSKNLFNTPFPFTIKDAENWFEKCKMGWETGEALRFAIHPKNIDEIIGMLGLHVNSEHQKAELGYWLGRKYWGNSYMVEALHEVLKYAFEKTEINKVFATHFLYNPASGKVMQKVGMKYEGLLKQEFFHQGKLLDVHRYAILKEEFV